MKKILTIAAICFCWACQPTLVAEFEDKAVVEGYLYAENTPTLKISKLIALRDDVAFSEMDIDALDITLTDQTSGREYHLSPQGEGAYSSPSLRVEQGHTYVMSFPYNGNNVTATTLIPPKPQGMALSATSISIMQRPSRADGPVEVTWNNPDGDYYMIVVECTEENPQSIYDWGDDEDDRPRFAFRTEPTQAASGQLSMQSFSYFGKHNVILVRMQPEYVLLYQSTGSTISEIHANVENGYGIFTGLNADTLQIRVNAASM